MWRYISDAANRFVTLVWNSLTFVFNLIPAPFVLLSINYKLLTFKNIFAFARAGFGSYSDLKMLANAVLVEKKPEDREDLHSQHQMPSVEQPVEDSEHEREQKIKARMFADAARGINKTKFVKDAFASIVKATGLLKGTKFYEILDQDGEVVLDEHRNANIDAVHQMRIIIAAGNNAESVAKVYLFCERLANLIAVHPRFIFDKTLAANDETFKGYGLSSPQAKLLLDRIIDGEVTLNKYIPKEVLDRVAKKVKDLSSVIKAIGVMAGEDIRVPALVGPVMDVLGSVVSGLIEKSGAGRRFGHYFARAEDSFEFSGRDFEERSGYHPSARSDDDHGSRRHTRASMASVVGGSHGGALSREWDSSREHHHRLSSVDGAAVAAASRQQHGEYGIVGGGRHQGPMMGGLGHDDAAADGEGRQYRTTAGGSRL